MNTDYIYLSSEIITKFNIKIQIIHFAKYHIAKTSKIITFCKWKIVGEIVIYQ